MSLACDRLGLSGLEMLHVAAFSFHLKSYFLGMLEATGCVIGCLLVVHQEEQTHHTCPYAEAGKPALGHSKIQNY